MFKQVPNNYDLSEKHYRTKAATHSPVQTGSLPGLVLTPGNLLQLQKTIGNSAVMQLLKFHIQQQPAGLPVPAQRFKDPVDIGPDVEIDKLDADKIRYYLEHKSEFKISVEEEAVLLERYKYLRGLEATDMDVDKVEGSVSSLDKIEKKIKGKRYKLKSEGHRRSVRERFARSGSSLLGGKEDYQKKEKLARFEHQQLMRSMRAAAGRVDQEATDRGGTAEEKSAGTQLLKKDISKYNYEGMTITYRDAFPLGAPDEFEFDHQPQSDIIKKAADLDVSAGKKIEDVADGHSLGGLTIILRHERHASGGTYGKASEDKDRLDDIDKSGKTDPEKISEIKDVLRQATIKDADNMIKVYEETAKNYGDIDILKENGIIDTAEADILKNRIKNQVLHGEGIIKSQTFDDWFNNK